MDNLDELDELEGEEEKKTIEETKSLLKRHSRPTLFGKVISGFGWKDVGEAFLGSLLFGFAMVVEEGTQEIGAFTSNNPIFFYLTIFFTIAVVLNILYFIDLQKVEVVNLIFGFIPKRLIGVLLIPFLTSIGIMTIWGRVNWNNTWLALNQIIIAWSVMAVGASLGDILPGT